MEPPPADSKLVQHERVTVTPHLGASTMEAQVCLIISLMHAALFCINFIFITVFSVI